MTDTFIPQADHIPVGWGWFEVLLILTFVLHLILMNFIVGGSLIAVWETIRGKKTLKAGNNIPLLIALTINLGVPPLLFVQVLYGHLFYSSSVVMALPWILIIPILIFAYYAAYIFVKQMDKRPVLSKTALFISTAFMLYIGFMWVNNSTLSITPERWSVYFTNMKGSNLNLSEPTLIPRFLHFMVAAVSIAGLGKALWAHFSKKMSDEERQADLKSGLKIFAWGTMVQVAIGTWFWLSQPRDIWMLFMGKSLFHTVLMGISWLLAITMILAAMRKKLWSSVIMAFVIIVIMAIMRELIRIAYLDGIFHPGDLTVAPEISPFIAFLITFVAGLLILWYMIRLIVKPQNQ
ncbi:MAG: hypothetical protein C0593_04165 [Marinilabiliales bacterium]|nr:MAG: hypothetical protein C0593_04165 [Marinilabiliales bacterium]